MFKTAYVLRNHSRQSLLGKQLFHSVVLSFLFTIQLFMQTILWSSLFSTSFYNWHLNNSLSYYLTNTVNYRDNFIFVFHFLFILNFLKFSCVGGISIIIHWILKKIPLTWVLLIILYSIESCMPFPIFYRFFTVGHSEWINNEFLFSKLLFGLLLFCLLVLIGLYVSKRKEFYHA